MFRKKKLILYAKCIYKSENTIIMSFRKLFLSIFIVCCNILANAQDSIYYESFALPKAPDDLISPEVLPDRRVIFRLYAPNAIDVNLISSCFGKEIDTSPFGTSEGMVKMQKDDSTGIWSFTTLYPVHPNTYIYYFVVDFINVVIDPQNPNDAWNTGSHYSVFTVGGNDYADLYLDNPAIAHGSTDTIIFYSKTFQSNRRFTVYLPPHYNKNKEYPLLFLLHGISGDEYAWLSLGRVAQICDNMIADGTIEPMIIVMPNCNVVIKNENEEVSTLSSNILNIPKQLSGLFERSFPEIIAEVESRYNVAKEKRYHKIAGLSSGGFQSANIANVVQDYFSTIGLFSATVWKGQIPKLIAESDSQDYYISVGRNDPVSWSLSKHFAQRTQKKHYYITFREYVGGHSWKNWREYLVDFLETYY